jgi:hypothetical protein
LGLQLDIYLPLLRLGDRLPLIPSYFPRVTAAGHYIINLTLLTVMYDHRYQRTRDPVRSPIDKLVIVSLVLGWVTTGESLMLYVFAFFALAPKNLDSSF